MKAAPVFCLFAAVALAQPPEPLPADLAPDMVLEDLRDAYRSGPVAEDVQVSVRPPDGQLRADRIIIRTDCTAVGPDDAPRRILLELGPLRVFLGDGRLVAVHTAEPSVFYARDLVGPLSPELLATLLPPVPAPQLALVAADRAALRTPVPFARGILWTSATLLEGTESYTVGGHGDGCDVALEADLRTRRVTRLTATVEGALGPTRLELVCRAIDPGDPERWAPDLAGREPVESLAALRAPRAAPELRPGESVPDFAFLAADMSSWSLHGAMRSASAATAGDPPPSAALLLFRVPADPGRAASIEDDARGGLAAIRAVLRPAEPAQRPRALARAAAVIELADYDRDRLQQLRQRWSESAPVDARSDADDLLWSSAGSQSADRLARDDDAMIAVIDPGRNLRTVIHLDGRAADTAAIADELRAALSPP